MKRLIIEERKNEGVDEEDPITCTVGLRVDALDAYVIIVFVSLLGDFIPILSFQPIQSQSFSSTIASSLGMSL